MATTGTTRSPSAQIFWNEIGNIRDDLSFTKSVSVDGLDRKKGSFLKRSHLQMIVKVHSLTQDYLRQVVHSVVLQRPKSLLSGQTVPIIAEQVMGATSLVELQQYISGELFRAMEYKFKNKSGLMLADAILKVLSKKDKGDVWDLIRNSAEPYFAIRHLIVHNQGRFDTVFESKFANVIAPPWGEPRNGKSIPGKAAMVADAVEKCGGVVKFLDERLRQFSGGL